MGYSERFCQLCAISFNVARIRTHDEPPEAGWNYYRSGFVSHYEDLDEEEELEQFPCLSKGCSKVRREGEGEAEDELEHIAGLECSMRAGYNGNFISVDEMIRTTEMVCLAKKQDNYQREETDADFELNSRLCFVTGISKTGPDEFDIENLEPVKHDVSGGLINNKTNDSAIQDGDWMLPMHPTCFDIFQRMSIRKFGFVDIDGLWRLREAQGEYVGRFTDMEIRPDVASVSEQWYWHVPGTEYLVVDPVRIPLLEDIIRNCRREDHAGSTYVFKPVASIPRGSMDPFLDLPEEIRTNLIQLQSRSDLANLRLASRAFKQIPQSYFRHQVKENMPWMWEVDDLPLSSQDVDWYELWNELRVADGGSWEDEMQRDHEGKLRNAKRDEVRKRLESSGTTPTSPNYAPMWREAMEKANNEATVEIEEMKRGYPPSKKPLEVRGLRNRRRIWMDIEEILNRISNLED